MMISKSGKKRIEAMVESLKKTLAGDDFAALDVSSQNDELDELAQTINALLKITKPASPPQTKSADNEERYRRILDTIEESYFEVDLQGNMLFFNDASPRDTRYSGAEIRRMNYRQFTDKRNAKKVYKVFHQVFLTGKPVKGFDWTVTRKDGSKIDVESSVSLMRDENGRPLGFSGISRDISQRKETERRLRLITENIHDAIWTRDFDLNYTYLSPSIFRLTGYTAEEIMQAPPNSLLPHEDYQRIHQELVNQLEYAKAHPFEKGETCHREIQTRHKDGREIWLEISANFNRDENGIPFEIIGITHDVTARKKAEAAFKDSEKRYRMIVENMHDTIWTMDLNLNYTYQSPSEIRVTGYTPEEIMNIPIDKALTPESFIRVSQLFIEELEKEFSGEPVNPDRSRIIEVEVYHKNGGTIWQEISASFSRDENGKPLEIMLVGRDITARKKMEAALKDSEKRYRMIVENMQDTITLLDLDLQYLYQSPSEIRVTGYTPEEIMQIPIEEQLTPESYAEGMKLLAREIEKEFSGEPVDPHRSISVEIECYRKDGGTVWLEETVTFNRDKGGKPVAILMAGRNITERKKAELERDKLAAQLFQSQKMETVGRLAGGVAHDFNNMLNVILGYIDLAKMRLPTENPIYSDLLEIEKAATRSRDLTAQLLAFSRKQIISPRVVNLNALVAETQKSITRLIGEDIDLKFYPGDDLWAIKFDPVQIEQILINLAVNARDAMPQGGRLLLETSNVEIDTSLCETQLDIIPGKYVLLSVSDTGTGIHKENIPFVFEPFFTTKDVGKGTGLGLATVYGIVKQNDGFISVYSEPDRGSAFKMYLPRTDEAPAVTGKPSEQPAQPGSGTILLVEDDEMVLKMVSDMLEALGYMVIATENPQDALSLCEKAAAPIDLVITDVVMPQMSGKELRDKLIVIRPDLKVLFMSGYTSTIIAQHGILEEGMQFIQKPFSINLLAEKVKQMMTAKT